MNTKRSISTYAALALTILMMAVSCQREITPIEQEGVQIEKGESVLSFSLENPGFDENTKSVITDPTFESGIKNILVLVVGSDGHWKKTYSTTVSGLKNLTIRADGSTSYTVYAFANMGEVDVPTVGGVMRPDLFAYTLPNSFSGLNSTGLPMAGSTSVPASSVVPNGVTNITVRLNRLLSKVIVRIDKGSMLTGASDGSALAGGSLKVCQVAKVVRPFATTSERRAQSSSEVYSTANSDYYNFTLTDRNNLVNDNIVLYIAENRQGNGSGSTQAGKTPASGRENLVTYLEYTAAKNGASDGVSGNMTYRVYLGENTTNNFNVIGDKVYSATLNLSWNGMWEGPWRVTSSGWADSRALVISAAANSSDPMITQNTKAGSAKVRKGTPTAFYMNFFPNGTSGSVAHSRKDQSSWPYGWVAYVDGSSVYMSGTSGIIKTPSNENLISWSYNTTTDCLSMETIPGAPASTVIHTLQFKTVDSRKESNMVYFTTSIPFEFRWTGDLTPNHVAQKNIISALDADTHLVDGTGVFHLKSAYADYIGLTDNHDGTATVSLLKPFSLLEGDNSPIYIEDADGDRHCDVPMESRLPHATCSDFWTTYVDASINLKYAYFSSVDNGTDSDVVGDPLIVTSDPDVIHCGQYLDYNLANSLIKPVLTSTNEKLGSELSLGNDGAFQLKTYIATYSDLVPSGQSFNVDIAKVEMYNYASRDPKTGMVYSVWNPWKNIESIAHSTTVYNDYTLFKRPIYGSPYWGWQPNPSDTPIETQDDVVLSLQNPVVLNEANVTFNTVWATAQSYSLGNISTGTPGKCASDYQADKWTLWMDVLDHTGFDKARVYNYLFGRGLYFVDINDMVDYISASDWRIAVGSAFFSEADAYNNTPSPLNPDTPSTRAYGVQGVQFTAQRNSDFSTWTFTYGMKGRTAENLKTHNAGKFNVVLQVVNPYDPTGARLSQVVADAYMRLHVYVTSQMTVGPELHRTSGPGAPEDNYWTFGCCPITTTSDYIPSLTRDLEERVILKNADEINSSISQGFYSGAGAAATLINKNVPFYFSFRNKEAFNGMSQSEAKIGLRNTFNNYATNPFTLANTSVLTSSLGADTYYRDGAFKLYYDPTGKACTYTYPETSEASNRYQLFVIHLFDGAGVLDRGCYYFDSSWNL